MPSLTKGRRPTVIDDDDEATLRIPRWAVAAPLLLPKGEPEIVWAEIEDATIDILVDADESMALRGIRSVAHDRSELSNEPTEDWIAQTLTSCLCLD